MQLRVFQPFAATPLVLCSALTHAAVLGPVQGPVYLGQALNIAVEVQLSTEDERSRFCLESEILYGETRKHVGLLTLPNSLPPAGQPFAIRIQHAASVDEPVVTVVLRDKCSGKTTRRYVLLADPPPHATATAQAPLKPTPVEIYATPATTVAATPLQPLATPSESTTRTPAASKSAAKPPIADTTNNKQTVKSTAPATGQRPRLRVTALDWTLETAPALKLSSELATPPSENPEQRLAAAALWKAINQSPEDIQHNAARIEQLEKAVAKLGEQDKQNQQRIDAVLNQLEASQQARYTNPLVYAIGLLSLSLIAAVAWLWRQNRQLLLDKQPWWEEHTRTASDIRRQTHLSDMPAVSSNAPALHTAETLPSQHIELSDPESDNITIQQSPSAFTAPASVQAYVPNDAAPDTGVLLSADLDDLRQQADFFMALGEHDEAIAILEQQIRERPYSAPGLYLDLLKALHLLGRRVHFEQYRAQFEMIFMGLIPSFEEWGMPHDVLEEFPDVCQGIAVRWPQAEGLEYISGLLRVGSPLSSHRFSLGALQELLYLNDLLRFMLYGEQEGQRISTSFGKLDLVIE
ncbi:hypothetical protein KIK84_01405 [Curvibacter sp. CHRR-16]|uniref:type IV pilus assembly protein FimV n=1 Tax=Curvibacter sp. CHRR-16 TaxID=2835872 RepID=UPI001BD99D34|nr:hypothetical protein [Curvibacter sp. CHRR-16]MBT0568971.1 hypothetical protein [Curvibacter sp. CHRR-16]